MEFAWEAAVVIAAVAALGVVTVRETLRDGYRARVTRTIYDTRNPQ
ncbi:hypothetical protein [Microbacterium aquimaris]|uniref:Uncharacterized protein n=1 Tax=Microbacterium aquimaris TaxID=459816 RepID=A0ABU5N5F8_9MICO|nr:hypothetical protein [Microbacterium aquimaris]MDZ8161324.1 hypothetical protein [Microbacterium aquimaris]MDZ8274747.1 hypothetical protein [Microbacterium aquimaris]